MEVAPPLAIDPLKQTFKQPSKKKLEKKQRKEAQRHMIEQREAALKEKRKEEKKKDKALKIQEMEREKEEQQEEEAWKEFIEKKEEEENQTYQEWKSSIQLEKSGSLEDEKEKMALKSKEVIEFLKKNKISTVEEIMGEFQMKDEKMTVKLILNLVKEEKLFGFLDENGKFICISDEEIESIKEAINKSGRMTMEKVTHLCNQVVKKKEG